MGTLRKLNWMRVLTVTAHAAWLTVRGLWLTLWTIYQIALGVALIGLVWGVLRVGEYFSIWDIRDLRRENPKTTAFIDSERGRLSDSLRTKGIIPKPDSLISWAWIPLDSIPKSIQEITLIAEDAKFFEHQGFDLEQIEYAIVANHQSGKKARGASTITQQLAKNLYLSKDKEMSRKLREAVITLALEHYLTKERILELYLNVAQFDEGVFGLRTASRHYLNKEPTQLTQDEAINLICLLPSPSKWNFKRPNSAYLQHKRLVQKNFALFKGMALDEDSTSFGWQNQVFTKLAEQLTDDRWKGLRTKAMQPTSDDSLNTDADRGQNSDSPNGNPASNGKVPHHSTRLRTF